MAQLLRKDTKQSYSKKQRVIIYIIVFSILALIYDAAIGGNMVYYAKWMSCGQKPVEVGGPGYLGSGAAYYYEPSAFPEIARSKSFCTPLEAEQAGYSANPDRYEFPHLNKQG